MTYVHIMLYNLGSVVQKEISSLKDWITFYKENKFIRSVLGKRSHDVQGSGE